MSNYITKPKPGIMINPLHPLSRGLVGCWLFNEGAGSLVNDISGYKNHGNIANVVPNTQGTGWHGSKYGGAMTFDGVNDAVYVGKHSSLDMGNGSFTVSTRFKLTSADVGLQVLIHKYAGANVGWFLGVEATDEIKFKYGSGVEHLVGTTTNPIQLNTDYILTVVHDIKGKDTIYVDGINIVESNAFTEDVNTEINEEIGRFSTFYFTGIIDEVRQYNRALSASEVKMLYEQPFCNLMNC